MSYFLLLVYWLIQIGVILWAIYITVTLRRVLIEVRSLRTVILELRERQEN